MSKWGKVQTAMADMGEGMEEEEEDMALYTIETAPDPRCGFPWQLLRVLQVPLQDDAASAVFHGQEGRLPGLAHRGSHLLLLLLLLLMQHAFMEEELHAPLAVHLSSPVPPLVPVKPQVKDEMLPDPETRRKYIIGQPFHKSCGTHTPMSHSDMNTTVGPHLLHCPPDHKDGGVERQPR
jgi:hypothetical protein